MSSTTITHEAQHHTFNACFMDLLRRVQREAPLNEVESRLQIAQSLSEFALGRFLIERGGLNGYWTHYIVTRQHIQQESLTELESFLFDKAPAVLATQERYKIFKEQIQKRLFEGCRMASIPSGLMGDLLELDYSNFSDFTLHALDIDADSITSAQTLAKTSGLASRCLFSCRDAWNLSIEEELDLISSNGLNIYVSDDSQVIKLYEQFYKALKPGGCLVTSFLTPPTEWNMDKVDPASAQKQKLIFADILQTKWQVFRSEAVVIAQLKEAGFKKVEIIYDSAHIFPTLIVTK